MSDLTVDEVLDDLTEWQRKAADVLLRQAESAEGPGVASFLRGQRRGVLLALDYMRLYR